LSLFKLDDIEGYLDNTGKMVRADVSLTEVGMVYALVW
jgi:hypothetical protein